MTYIEIFSILDAILYWRYDPLLSPIFEKRKIKSFIFLTKPPKLITLPT
jgi:hypothetical protein